MKTPMNVFNTAMKKKKKNRKGFSLVELIVVLVIMAILSAALIPSLIGYISKTKEQNVQSAPVWVVDDDHAIRWVLSRALSKAGIECRLFEEAESVLKALEDSAPMVLVSDIRMPGVSGVDLLARVKARMPNLPVIIMTAYSDLESAVSAFQGGAFEYLAKPFDITKAVELIERAMKEAQNMTPAVEAEEEQPASEESESQSVPDLIGQAPAMQEVFRAIGRLSHSLVTVLLTGESGAGKEVVARAIWRHSQRAAKPYIAINMAAIPRDLLESELFGHEKGAFTGATAQRLGRFEQARGGTLFLDEIGDMPMELQTRLLRVLSNGFFYRVGGHQPIKADVRIIAATNQNLEQRVKDGLFREDLYHRLNVIRLRLPPLRERPEDIAPLAEHFLRTEARALGVEAKRLTPEALARLEAFRFPGNVRQLENLCRWLLVMAPAVEVRVEDLPEEIREASENAPARTAGASSEAAYGDWTALLEELVSAKLAAGESGIWAELFPDFERTVIRTALNVLNGRRIEAAQRLGLGRNTITRKIQELGIEE